MIPKILTLLEEKTDYSNAIYTVNLDDLGNNPGLVAAIARLLPTETEVLTLVTNYPADDGRALVYLKLMTDAVDWPELRLGVIDAASSTSSTVGQQSKSGIRLLRERICAEKRDWTGLPQKSVPTVRVVESWLRGLPSCIDMPWYAHEIDAWAASEGLAEIEDHDEYWANCAEALSEIIRFEP